MAPGGGKSSGNEGGSILSQIAKAWGKGKSLYEVLGIAKDATSAAIRKAYFKLALTCVSYLPSCDWFAAA